MRSDQKIHDNKGAKQDEQGDQPHVNIKSIGKMLRAGVVLVDYTWSPYVLNIKVCYMLWFIYVVRQTLRERFGAGM